MSSPKKRILESPIRERSGLDGGGPDSVWEQKKRIEGFLPSVGKEKNGHRPNRPTGEGKEHA